VATYWSRWKRLHF